MSINQSKLVRLLDKAAKSQDGRSSRKIRNTLEKSGVGRRDITEVQWRDSTLTIEHGDPQLAIDILGRLREAFPFSSRANLALGVALAKNGCLEDARVSLKRAIILDEQNITAHVNLGNVLQELKQYQSALAHYQFALKSLPNDGNLHNNLANLRHTLGDRTKAQHHYSRSLELLPANADAHNNTGVLFEEDGDLDSAEASFRSAIRFNPHHGDAYLNLANLLLKKDQVKEAEMRLGSAIEFGTKNKDGLHNLGCGLIDKDCLTKAEICFKAVIAIDPEHLPALKSLAVSLERLQKFDELEPVCLRLIDKDLSYSNAYVHLAISRASASSPDDQMKLYETALSYDSDNVHAIHNIGIISYHKGDFEKAKQCYRKALSLDPQFTECFRNSTILIDFDINDPLVCAFRDRIDAANLEKDDECRVHFALAKIHDKAGDHETAFAHLVKGNRQRKELLSHDFSYDKQRFNAIIEVEESLDETPLTVRECSRSKPIFVVGMPRSGTSLLEQIISSHAQVEGAGELDFIKQLFNNMAVGIEEISSDTLSAAREAYLEQTEKLGFRSPFFVDKMPLNSTLCGLLIRAFPDGKVIVSNRDYRAVCWSNFKNYYPTNGLGFTYDLMDLKLFFEMHENLMEYLALRHPDKIIPVDYDALTDDPETQIRTLIGRLGLDWDEACLNPHLNTRTIKTASALQARSKIYKGSSREWQKYQSLIAKMFPDF